MILMDYLVILLLSITILYCWKLNKKIVQLNDSRSDLAKLFKQFEAAIIKADKMVTDIKMTGQRELLSLDRRIETAHKAINEIGMLAHTSKSLISTFETNITKAKIIENNLSEMHHLLNEIKNVQITQKPRVQHQNQMAPISGGIEMLASKTIPVYSGGNVNADKRAAIELLLDKISKLKGGEN